MSFTVAQQPGEVESRLDPLARIENSASSDASVIAPAPLSLAPAPLPTDASIPKHVARQLIGGTTALGLGVFIERGTGFLANILAARLGGAQTFGAYSLAITTANNISTYAAGGIGATTVRFSGKYPYASSGYKTLARSLFIVSFVSALLAAAGLWFGAAPIAHLLGKQALTGLLRWASISAAGIIVLECARGFFVGQRRLAALILLSLIVGVGMVTLLPLAARAHNPIRMILSQGAIPCVAVAACLLLARPLGLIAPASSAPAKPMLPVLKEVWSFGFIQLAGLIGSNLAGWWLTTLVARADTTLVQMSFFAIASQLRNLVGIAPGLLTEGSYAVMADPEGEATRTPHRVLALCSYASQSVSLLLASLGIVFVPWGLKLLYGHAYAAATVTTAIGLAIAVVHMGNAPAAARLTIVSIRSSGVINTVWAVFVAISASVFLFHGGSAASAMTIYFVGHVLSASLVLLTLRVKDHVPAGLVAVSSIGILTSGSLALLAFARESHPAFLFSITMLMLVIVAAASTALYLLGKHHRWLPRRETLMQMGAALVARLPGRRGLNHV